MHIKVSKQALLEGVTKGGGAALSVEADKNRTVLSPLVKSIVIKANDSTIEFSSATEHIYTYFTPNTPDVSVIESGEVHVSASYLKQWTEGLSNDAIVDLIFDKFDQPKFFTPLENDDKDDDNTTKISVNIGILGVLKLKANSDEAISEDILDSYDLSQNPYQNIDVMTRIDELQENFSMGSEDFQSTIKLSGTTSLKHDYEHVLDSILIQEFEGNLAFIATDRKRCSVYTKPNVKFNLKNKNDQNLKILVNRDLVLSCASASQKEDSLRFFYDQDNNHLYIVDENYISRIVVSSKDILDKYPNTEGLLGAPRQYAFTVSQKALSTKLSKHATLMNKEAVFVSLKNGALSVLAKSELGKKSANVNMVKLLDVAKELGFIVHVGHMMEFLKAVKSDSVRYDIVGKYSGTKQPACICLYSEDLPDMRYYMMTLAVNLYKSDLETYYQDSAK